MKWCEKLTRFYGLLKAPQNKRLTKSIFGLNNKPSKAKITWGLKYTDEDTPASVFIYCILISPDRQLSTSYKGGCRVPIKHIHCFCSPGSLIMLSCHSFFYNSVSRIMNELNFHSLVQNYGSASETGTAEILSHLISHYKITACSFGKMQQIQFN